jgi:hypothetical protein
MNRRSINHQLHYMWQDVYKHPHQKKMFLGTSNKCEHRNFCMSCDYSLSFFEFPPCNSGTALFSNLSTAYYQSRFGSSILRMYIHHDFVHT